MSKAAEIAQDYNISSLYLRGYLAGLRKITGSQYARLLEQVGLGKFTHRYPLSDFKPAAKGEQFIKLNLLMTEFLDGNFQELFLRNLGREFAKSVSTSPYLQEELKKVGSLTEPEHFHRALEIVNRLNRLSIEQEIGFAEPNDPIALEAITNSRTGGEVVVFKNCLYCAHLESPEKASCVSVVSYYKEIMAIMATMTGTRGIRFQCEEILCAAKDHHTDCYFLVRRA